MYTKAPLLTINRTAGEALVAGRIVICNASDSSKVEYPAAEYDGQLIGITTHDAALGEPIDVCVAGVVPLKVDGNVANIAPGDFIANHTADGIGRKAPGSAGTKTPVIGKALGAATADGAEIPVLITHVIVTTET